MAHILIFPLPSLTQQSSQVEYGQKQWLNWGWPCTRQVSRPGCALTKTARPLSYVTAAHDSGSIPGSSWNLRETMTDGGEEKEAKGLGTNWLSEKWGSRAPCAIWRPTMWTESPATAAGARPVGQPASHCWNSHSQALCLEHSVDSSF